MSEKIYFCLLILCGSLCQTIVQVLSEDVAESSDHFVRRKRVINLEAGGDTTVQVGVAPYVVNVKELEGGLNICVGTILSRHTVITVASCVAHYEVTSLKILAGSLYSFRGRAYNVTDKKVHIGDHPLHIRDGIALLTVRPAFVYNQNISLIALHQGALLAGTPATIFGWGYNDCNQPGTNYRYKLRSITLPIMRHRDCVNIYRNRAQISDKHLCTYDRNKRCGHTDTGAPLVVDNQLAGFYIWTGMNGGHINPDVFLIVQHLQYSHWIINNIVHHI